MTREGVVVIDFGSQYSQLIARRIRESNVYCEIVPPSRRPDEWGIPSPRGVILSGGPASVYARGAPRCDEGVFRIGVPVLGICYGMQLGTRMLGGDVRPAPAREFGRTELRLLRRDRLFQGIPSTTTVWMSHGDQVATASRDFEVLAATRTCPCAAVKHRTRDFYGVQFHPEVVHTPLGGRILKNFLYEVCGCRGDWRMKDYIETLVREVRNRVGKRAKVLCALSGGVDSSVAATLVHRAIGRRLVCVFVDNGLLRKDEAEDVVKIFRNQRHINLRRVDAGDRFLRKLSGVTDPERKRKIIGREFIDVFKREARKLKGVEFLVQGTLYPDVIESTSTFGGPSAKIKTHHNVGGLPEKLGFKLVEPLRYLFKDEVRRMGRALGLPKSLVGRQPFPGPGLAVRVIGKITPERLEILQNADEVVRHVIEGAGLDRKLWQYFAVLLPVSTVGVMGDDRTYDTVVAVRAVESVDGMTADWARLPYDVMGEISTRVINEVRGVNRVVFDISSKPPATIEWE